MCVSIVCGLIDKEFQSSKWLRGSNFFFNLATQNKEEGLKVYKI